MKAAETALSAFLAQNPDATAVDCVRFINADFPPGWESLPEVIEAQRQARIRGVEAQADLRRKQLAQKRRAIFERLLAIHDRIVVWSLGWMLRQPPPPKIATTNSGGRAHQSPKSRCASPSSVDGSRP